MRLELTDPAPPVTIEQKADLLSYASAIAYLRADPIEVRRHAETLEMHLFLNCATYGQQKAMLMAMRQVFNNRPGGLDPYLGHMEEFLGAVQELYAYINN